MSREHAFGLVSIAVGLVIACLPQAFPQVSEAVSSLLLFVGLAMAVYGSFHYFKRKPTQQETPSMGDDNRIQINSISGGQNRIGHEIHHHTPPQRHLAPSVATLLVRDLPNDRPVTVLGMAGNTESMAFAQEIYGFLSRQGYEMTGDRASEHMFFSPPVGNFSISEFNGGREWHIVVGPAS